MKEIVCVSLIAVGILFPTLTLASCPNKCSGHGTCKVNDVCECQQNWVNGDCSGRKCPYTRAWVDTATGDDDAHYYAECGNHGVCDRSTGECVCDEGYTGSGCRRMDCPNQCSGHGTCEFIEEMAKDYSDKRINGVSGRTYTLWDQEKIMGCKCDPWYEGHDCSQMICPKGDDPLTTGYDMQQYIRINAATTQFYLTYYDPYGNSYTTNKITSAALNADATTCALIQTALRRVPNHALDNVQVDYSATLDKFSRTAGVDPYTTGTGTTPTMNPTVDDANYIHCVVKFPSAPGTTGLQHLLGCDISVHNTAGMQPLTTGSASGTCEVAEYVASGTTTRILTELATCSNRGLCDSSTGKCECFAGHRGLACEKQEALV